jgi:hypothetical protein
MALHFVTRSSSDSKPLVEFHANVRVVEFPLPPKMCRRTTCEPLKIGWALLNLNSDRSRPCLHPVDQIATAGVVGMNHDTQFLGQLVSGPCQ